MTEWELGFPGGAVEESTCHAGDTGDAGSTLLGRSPTRGHGNALQYFSCLREIPWSHRVGQTEQLRTLSMSENPRPQLLQL